MNRVHANDNPVSLGPASTLCRGLWGNSGTRLLETLLHAGPSGGSWGCGGGRGRPGYDTGWGSLQLCRGRAPGGVRELDQEFHEALEVGVTTLPSLGSL